MSRFSSDRDEYNNANLYISDDDCDYPPAQIDAHFQEKYLYDYCWYHENFPQDWAFCHKDGTGPGQCSNCSDVGCVNGVFIGYCANCAIYDYNGLRGRGFIDVGIECSDEDALQYTSAFDTYLKDVDINSIIGIDMVFADGEINQDEITNEDIYGFNREQSDSSILDCHFEGGYNDM